MNLRRIVRHLLVLPGADHGCNGLARQRDRTIIAWFRRHLAR